MHPALHDGAKILVLRHWPARWLRRGQVVVTRFPERRPLDAVSSESGNRLYTKRVVALEGDTLISENGRVPASVLSRLKRTVDARDPVKWKVTDGHYFVRGDSPGLDSDAVGPIPFDCLFGLVILKLTGLSRERPIRNM